MTTASVLVPTTGERGPLLRLSLASVLAQTLEDLEVLVVGDGAGDSTRTAVAELSAADPRVRFFDFPKHPRRGEEHRHEVLRDHATGRFVAYLCDRDLWLPGHLAELDRVLAGADFGHTLRFTIGEDDRPRAPHGLDLRVAEDRARASFTRNVLPLSIAGHTLDAYRRLPHGWRTTPPDVPTDRFMWVQFLEQPWVRVATSSRPTALSFKRPRDWTVAQRLDVLERWTDRLAADPAAVDDLLGEVLDELTTQGSDLVRALRAREASSTASWLRDRLPWSVYRQVRRPARWARRRISRRSAGPPAARTRRPGPRPRSG